MHPTKVEMTLEKLQVIATAEASSKAKARWLRWWNGSESSRKTNKFPPSPCSENTLIPWLHRAAFWSNVSNLCSSAFCIGCPFILETFLNFLHWVFGLAGGSCRARVCHVAQEHPFGGGGSLADHEVRG